MVKRFDPTKPVRTRDGRPARIICTNRKSDHYPIVALLDAVGTEYVMVHDLEGRSCTGRDLASDLVNIPEKVTIHIYRGKITGQIWASTHYYPSAELHGSEIIKQVEIEV